MEPSVIAAIGSGLVIATIVLLLASVVFPDGDFFGRKQNDKRPPRR
jgi:hypothetical protein